MTSCDPVTPGPGSNYSWSGAMPTAGTGTSKVEQVGAWGDYVG